MRSQIDDGATENRGPRVRGYKIMTTPNEALRTILPVAGWCYGQAADVVFTGGADPVLPTPFRIGAAGAATLAASGLAATELWQVRTGRRQRVTVDLRQATAVLRSGTYPAATGHDSRRHNFTGSELMAGVNLYPRALSPSRRRERAPQIVDADVPEARGRSDTSSLHGVGSRALL